MYILIKRISIGWRYVGYTEYGHWAQERSLWSSQSKSLSQPRVNYISNADGKGKRRYTTTSLRPHSPHDIFYSFGIFSLVVETLWRRLSKHWHWTGLQATVVGGGNGPCAMCIEGFTSWLPTLQSPSCRLCRASSCSNAITWPSTVGNASLRCSENVIDQSSFSFIHVLCRRSMLVCF